MGNSIVTQRDTMLEKQRAGYIKLSLTNFTTSAEPTIAAGSVVEISGSLYSFTTNESITGWSGLSVGDAYIKLVPDGTNPCTAEFTATAPTWSDAKQGWYDGTGTDRYVAGLYKTSSTEYDNKYIITHIGTFDANIPGDNNFTGDNTFSTNPNIGTSALTGSVYTGSTQDETDLPIGSYIAVGHPKANGDIPRNSTKTIYLANNFYYYTVGSVALSGVWRSSGLCGGPPVGFAGVDMYLFRRVS